ncbi:response regulator transcription factor [Metabacillus iocasae]|uniref:DNA-binding response OmpR family regulator n=1 Tax=Priestia iocasae TaxID=2291674 RepID=A0ABS2QRX2_9BACI|nr:response regulator transcription factor [Metabacillus iocasae]MBM7702155.1 DNA-binding response OmpR family regulator [Metabacillus iocasae]
MNRVLYIEDNQEIGRWVERELNSTGYEVYWFQSGEGAIEKAKEVDIVVLDVMLPGLDGFSIGKRVKKMDSSIPILILSARTALEDKIEGLEFADDYVTKPFHPEELIARIEVLLRRFKKREQQTIDLRNVVFYPVENRIERKDTNEEVLLTGKQYQIFSYFIQHLNQILTKEQLYEGVWRESYIEGDKTLMVHIRYLREKLEKDPANPEIIETIRGVGYRVRG